MSESEKLISQDVIYICEPLKPEQEKRITDNLADVVKKTPLGFFAFGGLLGLGAAAIAKKVLADKQLPDTIDALPIDKAKNVFDSLDITLKNLNQLSVGMILCKHPFLPKTYIDINDAEKELFHKKQLCISSVMQYLGAKSVKGHAKVVESKRRLIDSRGKVSYENVKVNASVLSEQNQHYEAEYKIADTFPEEYSPSDYKLAIEEAAKFGLDKDDDIKSLIEQRNPEKPRPIKSRHVSIEMSRELNNVLDTAISLEAVGAELGGGYKEILETSKRVLFELEIEFKKLKEKYENASRRTYPRTGRNGEQNIRAF